MIPHAVRDVVEKGGNLVCVLSLHAFQDFLEELNVISAACFNDLLLWRGTLSIVVSRRPAALTIRGSLTSSSAIDNDQTPRRTTAPDGTLIHSILAHASKKNTFDN